VAPHQSIYSSLRARLSSANRLALLALAVLIVLGGALRVNAIGGDKFVSADEAGYAGNANRILAHEPYASFKWAPGTPFVFALATRLSGHRSLKITAHAHGPAQDTQVLIELSTLLLVAIVSWMLAGEWAAVIAVALCATYVPLILITRTYLSEPFGGLMFLAAMASATFARKRGLKATAAAGVIAGLTCLTRNDLAIGMGVIALAVAFSGSSDWGTRIARLAVFLGCLVLVVTPWVIYASNKEGRLVPITTSGPDALFIGTYLPGRGEQFPTVEAFKGEICRHLPRQCGHYPAGDAAPVFEVVQKRYPHVSEPAAATKAAMQNIKRYALGKPLSFASMMWNKFWNMWSMPWSGGNSGLHPDTSRPQHDLYFLLAWVGLLVGAFLIRRWELVTAALVLLAVSGLNTVFVAQPRDNVRFAPMLLTYGGAGLWLLITQRLIPKLRARRAPPPAPASTEPSVTF
jgi:4-amino-4-deoxy-L-arabinose transferase-like glycosyltransferase